MKVLVIRFSSIGDIVLCTPVLRCLKKIPGQEIETHFLTKKQFLSFAQNYPYIDKIHVLDNNLAEVIETLKQENFDFVVDLHKNLRSLKVKRALGKPSRSFFKLNLRKWLLTNFKMDVMPGIHIVDRLMEAARPLGISNDGEGLDFFIPAIETIDIRTWGAPFNKGFIAFVIGGTHFTKRLPAEKIAEICSMINKPVVLLGGPDDMEAGQMIEATSPERIFNGCGKFSLNMSASVVQQAIAVITHDTGLMHIAAAFRKPIASVWGNTVPEFGMYPYFPGYHNRHRSRIFEVPDLSCRPCSKIGYKKCPRGHFKCMRNISSESIADWANRFDSYV